MSNDRFKPYENENFEGYNLFLPKEEKQVIEKISKEEKIKKKVIWKAGYYRANPHRFCSEFIGLNLKTFQKILIFFMFHFNYFMYLASRGQGKSFLTAIFACCYAILYPRVKIIIASGKKNQSKEVIDKILELKDQYPILANEISDFSPSDKDPYVKFKGGSTIKTAVSSNNSRSKRSNVLIVDEFVQVDKTIINKVLRKFQSASRHPRYLDKPEYKHMGEENKEVYLSSAWYKNHWSYDKFKAFISALSKGKEYFVCGLPYQLAIKEDLLPKKQVMNEMSEDDFDEVGWSMEMECLWFGKNDKSYFDFDEINETRNLIQPIYPKPFYEDYKKIISDSKFKYQPKTNKGANPEIRFLSCDISLMGGKNNDASVYTIFRLMPRNNGYERQVIYMESKEGGHSKTQAIRIRQLFDDFDCDYIVLDCAGGGMAVYDQLVLDLNDVERGKIYEAFSCMNNKEMADRCSNPEAPKLIYSMKATDVINTECATSLLNNIKLSKLRLLVNTMEAKSIVEDFRGADKLSAEEKAEFIYPYLQTTLSINEIINLQDLNKENANPNIKLHEPRSGRKDRYSAIAYGNYFANELERDLLNNDGYDEDEQLVWS